MFRLWHVHSDMECLRCRMVRIWDISDVQLLGCGMFDMCDVQDIGAWDVGYMGYRMFKMWDFQ